MRARPCQVGGKKTQTLNPKYAYVWLYWSYLLHTAFMEQWGAVSRDIKLWPHMADEKLVA